MYILTAFIDASFKPFSLECDAYAFKWATLRMSNALLMHSLI